MGLTAENEGAYEESFATKGKPEKPDETASAGGLTGTLDTTDVGAGEGALLQTNANVDFGVSPTLIDGADPTDGENPLLVTHPAPLVEDDSKDAEKAEKERLAAIEADQKEQAEKQEQHQDDGSDDSTKDDGKDEKSEFKDQEGYDPGEHTAKEVTTYLETASPAEIRRVKALEKNHKPQPRTSIIDFKRGQ